MPLSKCLSPVRVKDPHHLGQYMYVPCGKCESCKSLQAYTWKKRLDSECAKNVYSLAITLTYAESCLPIAYIDSRTLSVTLSHVESKPTTRVTRDVLEDISKYYVLRPDGTYKVPVVCHYDLHQFIKVLKFYAPNIRWFIQSEIGPSTLRPHYHGILFFNEYDPEFVKTCIYKAWPKCDWSISQHRDSIHLAKSTSYCTSYVACYVALPKIHHFERFAQFHYSSNRPPIGSFIYDKASIEDFAQAHTLSHPYYDIKANEFSALPFIRSLEDKYFAKLPYYSLLDSSARSFLLSSYRYFAPKWPISKISRKCYKYRHYADAFAQFLERYPCFLDESISSLPQVFQTDTSLYRVYLVSKAYCTSRIDDNHLYLDYVYDLHNYKTEMSKLKKQYEYEQEFCNKRKMSPRWLIYKDAEFVSKWSNAFGIVPEWVEFTLNNYGFDTIEDFTSSWYNYTLQKNMDNRAYHDKIHHILSESHKTKANRSYQLSHPVDYLLACAQPTKDEPAQRSLSKFREKFINNKLTNQLIKVYGKDI